MQKNGKIPLPVRSGPWKSCSLTRRPAISISFLSVWRHPADIKQRPVACRISGFAGSWYLYSFFQPVFQRLLWQWIYVLKGNQYYFFLPFTAHSHSSYRASPGKDRWNCYSDCIIDDSACIASFYSKTPVADDALFNFTVHLFTWTGLGVSYSFSLSSGPTIIVLIGAAYLVLLAIHKLLKK